MWKEGEHDLLVQLVLSSRKKPSQTSHGKPSIVFLGFSFLRSLLCVKFSR